MAAGIKAFDGLFRNASFLGWDIIVIDIQHSRFCVGAPSSKESQNRMFAFPAEL